MKEAVIKQIDSDTWQFTEQFLGENVYCYLLVGTEQALLVDTAYGFTNIAGAIREITSLPLMVVNTHGHFDHITGNYCFGEAYMHQKDSNVYRRHTTQHSVECILKGIAGGGIKGEITALILRPTLKRILSHSVPNTKALPECGYFELGKRRVDILETPGHTHGSISLLDRKNGWLFSGDTCGDEGMLLHFQEASTVKTFHDTILSIQRLVDSGSITRNYPSHQTSPAPLERLINYLYLLERLDSGNLTPEEWEKGVVERNGIKITFSPDRVKEELV